MVKKGLKKIIINYLTTFITFLIVYWIIKFLIWQDLTINLFHIALISCISFLDPLILDPILRAINRNKKLQELNQKLKRK